MEIPDVKYAESEWLASVGIIDLESESLVPVQLYQIACQTCHRAVYDSERLVGHVSLVVEGIFLYAFRQKDDFVGEILVEISEVGHFLFRDYEGPGWLVWTKAFFVLDAGSGAIVSEEVAEGEKGGVDEVGSGEERAEVRAGLRAGLRMACLAGRLAGWSAGRAFRIVFLHDRVGRAIDLDDIFRNIPVVVDELLEFEFLVGFVEADDEPVERVGGHVNADWLVLV